MPHACTKKNKIKNRERGSPVHVKKARKSTVFPAVRAICFFFVCTTPTTCKDSTKYN